VGIEVVFTIKEMSCLIVYTFGRKMLKDVIKGMERKSVGKEHSKAEESLI